MATPFMTPAQTPAHSEDEAPMQVDGEASGPPGHVKQESTVPGSTVRGGSVAPPGATPPQGPTVPLAPATVKPPEMDQGFSMPSWQPKSQELWWTTWTPSRFMLYLTSLNTV